MNEIISTRIIMPVFITRYVLHSSSLVMVLLVLIVTARGLSSFSACHRCAMLHFSLVQAWNSVVPHFCIHFFGPLHIVPYVPCVPCLYIYIVNS